VRPGLCRFKLGGEAQQQRLVASATFALNCASARHYVHADPGGEIVFGQVAGGDGEHRQHAGRVVGRR